MNGLLRAAGIGCMLFLASACGQQPALTVKENRTVDALTLNLKTRCVGRYLIDMPADAVTGGRFTVNDVKIEATPMSLEDFRKAMRDRDVSLRRAQSPAGLKLYKSAEIGGIPESRYFNRMKDSGSWDAIRYIEAYRWSQGYQIRMGVEASDAEHSVDLRKKEYVSMPFLINDPNMNDYQEMLQLVISLLDRARGRPEEEIPTEPGLCFLNGFLAGPQRKSEDADYYFASPQHHDVMFGFETNTDVHDTTTLLQRGKDINAAIAGDSQGKTIRKGGVALQGMKAEEWLIKGTTTFHIPGYQFALEANPLPNKDNLPVVTLDLSVGSPSALTGNLTTIEKASLTEDESVTLWDAVSRTLRQRPNGF